MFSSESGEKEIDQVLPRCLISRWHAASVPGGIHFIHPVPKEKNTTPASRRYGN